MDLMTRHKKCLTEKELQIKMSSLLNVSNVSNMSEEFSLKDIEVLVDKKGQNWFKRAHVRKFWGLAKILMSVEGLDTHEMPQRHDIEAAPHARGDWPGPKDEQNKTDKFLSKKGVQYVISRSRKSTYNLRMLAKALGIYVHENKPPFKEQETILNVMTAFKGEKMRTQYNVDGYRIDLYLPKHKLVLECDEFHHRDRDIGYEVERQKHVEEMLGCKFIRYNPDAEDFNLFKVINRIFLAIQQT